MREWLKIVNKSEATEILINGDITSDTWNDGWYDYLGLEDPNIYPGEIKKALDEADGEVHFHINSGGGDLFAGVAIGNMIKNHKGKTVAYVDGLAASAASVIALACDEVIIPSNAYLMIHRVSGGIFGDADDLAKAIDTFNTLEEGIINGYMEKVKEGVTREQITNYLKAETWFTGLEAKEVFEIKVEESNNFLNYATTKDKTIKGVPETILKAKEHLAATNKAKAQEVAKNELKRKEMELELALKGI